MHATVFGRTKSVIKMCQINDIKVMSTLLDIQEDKWFGRVMGALGYKLQKSHEVHSLATNKQKCSLFQYTNMQVTDMLMIAIHDTNTIPSQFHRGITYSLCTCEHHEYFIELEPSMKDSLHMYMCCI